MGIHYTGSKIHWNYFLTLEQDFQAISRFIEPCEANNNTFSIELARIIMASTQEVDVIMKNLCLLLNDQASTRNINEYYPVIFEKIPDLLQEEVTIPRFSMSSKPWGDWENNKSPLWWIANNKIKHERATEFHEATLKNAFNSMAGLLIVTAYFYKKELEGQNDNREIDWKDVTNELSLKSNLFKLQEDYYHGSVIMGGSAW